MAPRVKKHLDLLKVLHGASPKLRKAILKTADNDAVRCLCDCTHNLLTGNLKFSPQQKRNLVRLKRPLRQLVTKSLPLSSKRKLLVQHGGLVGAILTPILAIAASLLADKISKKWRQ